ncbi:hypothetical protein PENDEC_c026G05136 [Penicillium decumbens]|nr:hypothetical protein PENDEC_c026G05136 [Penicillium decumbens]
MFDTSIP